MKVLMLNGSPHAKGCTYTALHEMEKILPARRNQLRIDPGGTGSSPGLYCLRPMPEIRTLCLHHGFRKSGFGKMGKCRCADPGIACLLRFRQWNIYRVSRPLFYAAAFDKRYKLGASVVSCRRGGASATFDQLNKYFTISSMPIVSSQYWNSVHGNTPEEVLQDQEGLQTMRTLARNMSYLLKCLELGKAQLPMPDKEPKTATNFIR